MNGRKSLVTANKKLHNRRVRGWMMDDGDLVFKFRRLMRDETNGVRVVKITNLRVSREAFTAMVDIANDMNGQVIKLLKGGPSCL